MDSLKREANSENRIEGKINQHFLTIAMLAETGTEPKNGSARMRLAIARKDHY